MPFNLDCPCPEQTKAFDFDATVAVDERGKIIDATIPSLIDTPFDRDEVQRSLNADAYALWKLLCRQVRCPKPCREVISGSFETIGPTIQQIRGGPNPAPGLPQVVRTTDLWTFKERLKMTAKCINE